MAKVAMGTVPLATVHPSAMNHKCRGSVHHSSNRQQGWCTNRFVGALLSRRMAWEPRTCPPYTWPGRMTSSDRRGNCTVRRSVCPRVASAVSDGLRAAADIILSRMSPVTGRSGGGSGHPQSELALTTASSTMDRRPVAGPHAVGCDMLGGRLAELGQLTINNSPAYSCRTDTSPVAVRVALCRHRTSYIMPSAVAQRRTFDS
jgi:hypothetical protein